MTTAESRDKAANYFEQVKEDGQDNLQAALLYLEYGLSIIPLCHCGHVGEGREHAANCTSPGKTPVDKWTRYQVTLPTKKEIEGAWRRHSLANVGMCLGPVSGLVAFDVDGDNGMAELQRISDGNLPPTWEFTRGPSSRRILYRIPKGVTFKTTTLKTGSGHEELRFMARGSQTVMPPSRHAAGERYLWVEDHGPGEIDPAFAPPWVIRLYQDVTTNGVNGVYHVHEHAKPIDDAIGNGRRNNTLTSLAGTMRRRGAGEEAIYAALVIENQARCRPPLADADVRKIAKSIARYAPKDVPEEKKVKTAKLIKVSSLQKKPVKFIWQDRLIGGAINLIDGDPGLGKSFVALDIAARISTGRPMPGEITGGMPGSVILLTHEDDGETTIRPRLERLGADLDRITILDEVHVQDEPPRQLLLPTDCDLLEETILKVGAVLVVFDPELAFFDGEIDSHKDADVRKVMHPLKKMAERTGVAFLGIRHLNKLVNVADPMYRGGGSIAIIGAARSALIVAKDPDDDERRLLGRVKGNLSAEPDVLAYSFVVDAHGEPTIEWQGKVDVPVSEFLARSKSKEKDAQDAAKVKAAGTKLLNALDKHDPERKGMTEYSLAPLCLGVGKKYFDSAKQDLITQGVIEPIEVEYRSGKGKGVVQTTPNGLRRKPQNGLA
jgi:hypothetical protein